MNAAAKAPTAAPTIAAAVVPQSVVPAPHIRLASFIHTTTTLEQSPAVQSPAIQESPALPALAPMLESELAESTPLSPGLADEASPQSSNRPWRRALNSLPLSRRRQLPVASPPAPSLPFSAEVAATLELEADAPRAAFEVDHFAWPELCDSLLEKRASEFDQLVGQLVTESALGRKVVAITGSRRGDGRTTLALLLARRLAATAVKVVVVDADFEVPQLAARLGMTVQSGWENILADGLPVWDGLVESH